MISQWKLRKLVKIGEDFRCPLILPPFDGDFTEASFDIEDFKESKDFQEFLIHIYSLEIEFEYAKYKDRFFLVIKVK
jgi:hypothetical protein